MTATEAPRKFAGMLRPIRLDTPTGASLARGGVYSTVGLAAQGILRFATTLLVGHLAGKSQLGVVATAISTAVFLAYLWPTSTGSAASKFLARARGAQQPGEILSTAAHLRRRAMQTGILLGLVSMVVWVLLDNGTWPAAVCVAALTAAYSGYSFTRGIQFGAGQVPRATGWDVASVVIGLAALAGLLVTEVRGPVLILPLVLTYGLYTLAGWPYAAAGRPVRERRRELDGFVALGAAGSLASTGFLQSSQIAAKLVGGNAGAGQYAAAQSLATPASMLAVSLGLVLLPAMSEAWGRGDHAEFHARTDRATRSLAIVMVGVFGTIIVCSRLIIAVVWGSGYHGAVDILPILVLAVLTMNLGLGSINSLNTRSQRGMSISTGASILGMLVGVAVWVVLAPRLGGVGVALGYLCGTVVIAGVPVSVVWRTDRHRWGWVFGRVFAGLAIVAAVFVLQRLTGLAFGFDPLLALGFLAVWLLLNRADVARLPIPAGIRRRFRRGQA